jgi:hypothetical protein
VLGGDIVVAGGRKGSGRRKRRPHRGLEKCRFVDATRLATALLGNSTSANTFLVSYAYQIGALPLSAEAIDLNRSAFRFGRYAAVDLPAVDAQAAPMEPEGLRLGLNIRVTRKAHAEHIASGLAPATADTRPDMKARPADTRTDITPLPDTGSDVVIFLVLRHVLCQLKNHRPRFGG